MNGHSSDRLMRQASSAVDATVASLDLSRGGQKLLEEIVATSTVPRLAAPRASEIVLELSEDRPFLTVVPPPVRRHRGRVPAMIAGGAAVAAAIAGPSVLLRGGSEAVPAARPVVVPASSPAVVEPNGNPWLLIDDPAWKITDVNEKSPTQGEITFNHGTKEISVAWYPAGQYQTRYRRLLAFGEPGRFDVLGRRGTEFSEGDASYSAILPPDGSTFVLMSGGDPGSPGRGGAGRAMPDRSVFRTAMTKLKKVSAKKWAAAMPDSVILPSQAEAVVEQILADVPLPPGFDGSGLRATGAKNDYTYGVVVLGNVTCAWLTQYDQARKAKDESGMAAVEKGLGGSRQWATLQRMRLKGAYPLAIWAAADRVARRQESGNFAASLGCDPAFGRVKPGAEPLMPTATRP